MNFHKTTLSAVLLTGVFISGAALAQTNTNSGTSKPDASDTRRDQQKMIPPATPSSSVSGATNTDSGTKTPDEQDQNRRAQSQMPNTSPSRVTGSGASNTNSGTATPDETDANAKKVPANALGR